MDSDKLIPISALQHYAFCPRQCALIHVERAWEDNLHTAEGNMLHERVDSGESETRYNLRIERSVNVISEKYGLIGKLDMLEIDLSANEYVPVEYKKGRPKVEDWDRVQLCAQALCLESMTGINISKGAIWYWQVRKREWISIDEELREKTINIGTELKKMLDKGITPAAVYVKQRCQACSLVEICQPKIMQKDSSKSYLKKMFEDF